MKTNKWLKYGLGGVVALVASAGLVVASPALAQGVTASVAAVGAQIDGAHGGGPKGFGGANNAVVAQALSMTEAELRTELQTGKSIADVASAKGVSIDTIVSAVVADQTTKLAQSVTDGRLTQAQADTLLANLKTTLPSQLQVKHVVGLEGRGGKGGFGGLRGANTAVVATALNMTEAELRTELQAGKTIAAIAQSKSIDLNVVSAALLADEKTRVAQAVTDGKLTQAQADEKLANAQARITEFLNGTQPLRGPGRGGPRPGTTPGATPAAPGA